MNKRALVIGINDYRAQARLQGCVNDTTNLRLVLGELAGFAGDQIRMLVDARATRAAIERQLRWLVDGAAPGDLLVLHFSGHGSQVRDRGVLDEADDELDEILCPWDMDWNGTFIDDDYLDEALKVPEGVALEVILDCCNSGGAGAEHGGGAASAASASDAPSNAVSPGDEPPSAVHPRVVPPAAARAGEPVVVPRFLPPPARVARRLDGSRSLRRLLARREPNRLASWSACAASQTAADTRIDGVPHGAFTFYFCKHLRDAGGALARAALLERVRMSLRQAGYSQVPELAAPPEFLLEQPFTRGLKG